jgi:hypothetical protein
VALPGPEGQAGPERGGRGQAAQGAPRHQGRLSYFNHKVPTPPPLREGRQVEIIIPPPPHWDRRAIQPNHIKFRTCSALAGRGAYNLATPHPTPLS